MSFSHFQIENALLDKIKQRSFAPSREDALKRALVLLDFLAREANDEGFVSIIGQDGRIIELAFRRLHG